MKILQSEITGAQTSFAPIFGGKQSFEGLRPIAATICFHCFYLYKLL
jgi:hypothetical protein